MNSRAFGDNQQPQSRQRPAMHPNVMLASSSGTSEDAAPPTANAPPTMDRYSGGAPEAGTACKLLHCREEGGCRAGGKGRGEGM